MYQLLLLPPVLFLSVVSCQQGLLVSMASTPQAGYAPGVSCCCEKLVGMSLTRSSGLNHLALRAGTVELPTLPSSLRAAGHISSTAQL